MGLAFMFNYRCRFFCLFSTFFIVTFPIFSAFFTYAYMDPAYFVKSSSLLDPDKPHQLAFIVHAFWGISKKKLREVMAAYVLYSYVNIYLC